jgi:serine/threonine-protein kinase HipA
MSARCPLTYEVLVPGARYSLAGLRQLSPKLTELKDFPYAAAEQRQEALKSASKISIQGLQPKISTQLSPLKGEFVIVTRNGKFIFKPQSVDYAQMPENEDLSMHLASLAGIEVPLHGLLRCVDQSFTYFIKRMDRVGHKDKIALEDFAQLTNQSRETKYNASIEKIIEVVQKFCTFPQLEMKRLFHRILFNFLIGNEDMHLKNYSLITLKGIHRLAPAYDFLNTTIVLANSKEESALPLNGKKNHLTQKDLLVYLPEERMVLNKKTRDDVLTTLKNSVSQWDDWIAASFLSEELKGKYRLIVKGRRAKLGV